MKNKCTFYAFTKKTIHGNSLHLIIYRRKLNQKRLALAHQFAPLTLGQDRLHLRKTQINLVFHSVCTTFAAKTKKERC